MDSIDYYKLYCDFSDSDFLASLQLSEEEQETLSLLTQQVSEENRCYVPQLFIEGLVGESSTPYGVLCSLYTLKARRIIFYGLSEAIPKPVENATQLVDTALQGALRYKEATGDSLLSHLKGDLRFERYAVLNVEYPVVYSCMKEEVLRGDFDLEDVSLFYAAIRANRLGFTLNKSKCHVMLEFVNYIQSLFNQPLSKAEEEDHQDEKV